MMPGRLVCLVAWCVLAVSAAPTQQDGQTDKQDGQKEQIDNINLLMPKVKPQTPDTYLCTSMKIEDAHRYITGFTPTADAHIAHHVLLYGCDEPGEKTGVWNCGEMSSQTPSDYRQGPVCASGSNILYAWAMEAPRLGLPQGVGFDIGQDTAIKYLVLQIHYKNVSKFLPPENGDDSSGLTLETTTVKPEKEAGVYLLGTGGSISPHTVGYFETACPFQEQSEIVPFAFRTHAHTLGRVISGYRVRDGVWTEIGRKDPRLPEMFYNVTTPGITIKPGDILAARCTMENTRDRIVEVGATQEDEMCNFYIMYHVTPGATPPRGHSCFTPGPPSWYWEDYTDHVALNVDGVPDTASVIPGTDKPLINNDTMVGSPAYAIDRGNEFSDMTQEELMYLMQSLAEEEEEEEERRRYMASQYGGGYGGGYGGLDPIDAWQPLV